MLERITLGEIGDLVEDADKFTRLVGEIEFKLLPHRSAIHAMLTEPASEKQFKQFNFDWTGGKNQSLQIKMFFKAIDGYLKMNDQYLAEINYLYSQVVGFRSDIFMKGILYAAKKQEQPQQIELRGEEDLF